MQSESGSIKERLLANRNKKYSKKENGGELDSVSDMLPTKEPMTVMEQPDMGVINPIDVTQTIQPMENGGSTEGFNKIWRKFKSDTSEAFTGKKAVYVDFLNSKNAFKRERKYFSSYEEAHDWCKANFDKFSPDMIHYNYADGGMTSGKRNPPNQFDEIKRLTEAEKYLPLSIIQMNILELKELHSNLINMENHTSNYAPAIKQLIKERSEEYGNRDYKGDTFYADGGSTFAGGGGVDIKNLKRYVIEIQYYSGQIELRYFANYSNALKFYDELVDNEKDGGSSTITFEGEIGDREYVPIRYFDPREDEIKFAGGGRTKVDFNKLSNSQLMQLSDENESEEHHLLEAIDNEDDKMTKGFYQRQLILNKSVYRNIEKELRKRGLRQFDKGGEVMSIYLSDENQIKKIISRFGKKLDYKVYYDGKEYKSHNKPTIAILLTDDNEILKVKNNGRKLEYEVHYEKGGNIEPSEYPTVMSGELTQQEIREEKEKLFAPSPDTIYEVNDEIDYFGMETMNKGGATMKSIPLMNTGKKVSNLKNLGLRQDKDNQIKDLIAKNKNDYLNFSQNELSLIRSYQANSSMSVELADKIWGLAVANGFKIHGSSVYIKNTGTGNLLEFVSENYRKVYYESDSEMSRKICRLLYPQENIEILEGLDYILSGKVIGRKDLCIYANFDDNIISNQFITNCSMVIYCGYHKNANEFQKAIPNHHIVDAYKLPDDILTNGVLIAFKSK